MPTRGAPAGQVRRRRGSGRATVRAMDPSPQEPRGADLLTVALLVFFLALIGIVAALLILPQIVG
jgi:hypothetical protein